eukprot:scaffold119288_cov18-Tisochrysis_lutea.AAC.1
MHRRAQMSGRRGAIRMGVDAQPPVNVDELKCHIEEHAEYHGPVVEAEESLHKSIQEQGTYWLKRAARGPLTQGPEHKQPPGDPSKVPSQLGLIQVEDVAVLQILQVAGNMIGKEQWLHAHSHTYDTCRLVEDVMNVSFKQACVLERGL